MKILIIHNHYQIIGGEDGVMKNEVELLIKNGNNVTLHTVNNEEIVSISDKLLTLLRVPFSFSSYKKIKKVLLNKQPDVVHIHNYFPLLSPSIFYACNKLKIPVVHTLHNYRAVCPTALLMHDGKLNETSINNYSWWAVKEKVYRNSYIGSFVLASMVELHKRLGTWQTKVDRFIALTEFSRQKYIEAGWPANKIVVKPNFIEDPFNGVSSLNKKGVYALFVGRLSEEKGIDILFNAFKKVDLTLKIIGDGPLKGFVEEKSCDNIEFLGRKEKDDVLELVKNASFIIMPSTWYEGFPMVLVESFACGTPALVSKLGSMEEIIVDGVTGLHFEAGNPNDLATKVQWMIDNPDSAREMGANTRAEYLAKYTPEKNHEMLINIYQQAIDEVNKKNEK
jgi:glycosyltransferase involved in cell wall biosynthesis